MNFETALVFSFESVLWVSSGGSYWKDSVDDMGSLVVVVVVEVRHRELSVPMNWLIAPLTTDPKHRNVDPSWQSRSQQTVHLGSHSSPFNIQRKQSAQKTIKIVESFKRLLLILLFTISFTLLKKWKWLFQQSNSVRPTRKRFWYSMLFSLKLLQLSSI